jgi:hypothetical protein
MYDTIETFDELCQSGIEYINGTINSHIFLSIDNTKSNLYELVGEKEFIKNYLLYYNSNGFYTVMSQPCADYEVSIFANCYDYKLSHSDVNIKPLNGKYGVKQRAEVQGFMHKNRAENIYNYLKLDKNIKVLVSTINENIPINEQNYRYATLSYKYIDNDIDIDINNDIKFMEAEDDFNENIRTELHGVDRNAKLKKLKHIVRRYFIARSYPLKRHVPNLIDNDIVGISFMDLTWNRETIIWNKISECLDVIKC